MIEHLQPPQPDRLGKEQNIFDQSIFNGISELGASYGSVPHMYAATRAVGLRLISDLVRANGLNSLDTDVISPFELLQDEIALRVQVYRTCRDVWDSQFKSNLKGFPDYLGAADKRKYMQDLVASIMGNLDEPIPQMLYLYTNRYLYTQEGQFRYPQLQPAKTYPAWLEAITTGSQLPEGYHLLGLEGILNELGFSKSPTSPEGGKRPVNRFWRTLPSTGTNHPAKKD